MGKPQRIPGRARKRDDNEPEIIDALEHVGARVFTLDKPLDLLVIFNRALWLLEVKNGAQPPSWQRITPEQQTFLDWADGYTDQVHVVNDIEPALRAIGAVSDSQTRPFDAWLELLDAEAERRDAKDLVKQTGRSCWAGYWADGYDPRDALFEDWSNT